MPRSWYVGLDYNEAFVTAAIASPGWGGRASIVERAVAPCAGLSGGQVADVPALRRSLRPLLEWVRRATGGQASTVALAVSGDGTRELPSHAAVSFAEPVRIDGALLEQLRRQAVRRPALAGPVLQVIPAGFACDGRRLAVPPVGMMARAIQADYRVWVARPREVEIWAGLLGEVGFSLGLIEARASAAAGASLHDSERRLGAIVLDLGQRTTDVAVYLDGRLAQLGSLPLACDAIVNDIAAVCGVPTGLAGSLVGRLGTADPDADERLRAANLAARARVAEILMAARAGLEREDLLWRVASGVVLSGDGARLPWLPSLARQVFGMPARVAAPGVWDDLTWSAHPGLAAALGLIEAQARLAAQVSRGDAPARPMAASSDEGFQEAGGNEHRGGILPVLGRWLKEFVPHGEPA